MSNHHKAASAPVPTKFGRGEPQEGGREDQQHHRRQVQVAPEAPEHWPTGFSAKPPEEWVEELREEQKEFRLTIQCEPPLKEALFLWGFAMTDVMQHPPQVETQGERRAEEPLEEVEEPHGASTTGDGGIVCLW